MPLFLLLYVTWLYYFMRSFFYGANTVNAIRDFSGFFSDYEVYAVIILLFHEKFELCFSRKKTLFFTYLIGFSAFMYLARTNFIQFVILFLAMKGFLKINKTKKNLDHCIFKFNFGNSVFHFRKNVPDDITK